MKVLIQYWGPGEDWFTMDPINKMSDMQGVKMLGGGGVKPDIAKSSELSGYSAVPRMPMKSCRRISSGESLFPVWA